jgi:PIN domain nuclease of toxin-antitoxin system
MAGVEQENQHRCEHRFVYQKCASYVQVLAITQEIAVRSVQFPNSYPSDPQDRIIGVTAIVEGIRLLTHDKLVARSGLVPLVQ